MKRLLFVCVAVFSLGAHGAHDAEFIRQYDAGDFASAAKLISSVDTQKPEVARRLGTMYFKGEGVACDSVIGIRHTMQSAMAGDVVAMGNLVKMFVREGNYAQAAASLVFLEQKGGFSSDEIEKFRKTVYDAQRIGNAIEQGLSARIRDRKMILDLEVARKKDRETALEKDRKHSEEIAELKREKTAQEQTIERLTKQVAEVEAKLTARVSEVGLLKNKLTSNNVDGLREQIEHQNGRIEQLNASLSDLQNEKTKLTRQVEADAKKLKLFNLVDKFIQEEYNPLMRSGRGRASDRAIADEVNNFFQRRYNPLRNRLYGEDKPNGRSKHWVRDWLFDDE